MKRRRGDEPPVPDSVDHDVVDANVLAQKLIELSRARPRMFELVREQLVNAGLVQRPKPFLA